MTEIKEKILLGGFPQKIHVKTDDEKKPVLLFLHGGPGVCNRHTIFADHSDLMDSFTIATWDQRGSGGSYKGVDVSTLTINQLVEDANELVLWLFGLAIIVTVLFLNIDKELDSMNAARAHSEN